MTTLHGDSISDLSRFAMISEPMGTLRMAKRDWGARRYTKLGRTKIELHAHGKKTCVNDNIHSVRET